MPSQPAPMHTPELKPCQISVTTFLDQIDACIPETDFWQTLSSLNCPTSMDVAAHRGEGGGTTFIYHGAKLVGMTIMKRDQLNRTVLVCVDLRAPSPGEAALLAALQGLMDAGIAVADSLAEFLDKRKLNPLTPAHRAYDSWLDASAKAAAAISAAQANEREGLQ